MESYMDKIMEMASLYGVKIITALVVFIVGRWIAKGVRNLIVRLMKKAHVDPILINFTSSIAYIALLAFIIIAALGQLGIQTTSFIAILGAAGLAIGLALQGSLSNFAAGFLMVLFRPFNEGDYIQGGGDEGTVEQIQIFTTTLVTLDNKTVIIPNAKLTSDNIVNWTVKGTRRVDLVFGIGYGDDIDKARKIIDDVLGKDNRILNDPAIQVSVAELGDSSVNFVVRPWVKCDDYWDVYMDTTENIKKAFDAGGINIPFPQRDVHLYQH
ncbi:MAG: mechanosensitive ion channel domain-containing protein [Thermodesulfobacteriota bacterium]